MQWYFSSSFEEDIKCLPEQNKTLVIAAVNVANGKASGCYMCECGNSEINSLTCCSCGRLDNSCHHKLGINVTTNTFYISLDIPTASLTPWEYRVAVATITAIASSVIITVIVLYVRHYRRRKRDTVRMSNKKEANDGHEEDKREG